MASILSLFAQNGWRESLRILLSDNNRILRRPRKPHSRYAYIRHQQTPNRRGKHKQPHPKQGVYEKNVRTEKGKKLKTYRRVDDGLSGDEVDGLEKEIATILEKKRAFDKMERGKSSRRPARRAEVEKEKERKNRRGRLRKVRKEIVREESNVELVTEQMSEVYIDSQVSHRKRIDSSVQFSKEASVIEAQRLKMHRTSEASSAEISGSSRRLVKNKLSILALS
ncbi:hypothetical protein P280DRAFT_479570 [Massarina eburnea CBS 473.64]|uniref:Uncharacterized protein n=1 Tax=Massarina eburnea CBS 473.64 TaxID=1395130 RepID=A0A6A6RZZ7_9PLEO|nr:hypothetical protein P280DRAFT_479570 [Massarina eburnea CBS 473.64]